MALTPITSPEEVRAAFKIMSQKLKKGAKPYRHYVGWQGGGGEYTIYWRQNQQMWALVEPREIKNRYWCCFGIEYPPSTQSLSITCEVNPPIKGVDRRIAGAFLRDDMGSIYIAHSGKVGGARKGVGRSAFLSYWRSPNVENVQWPDEKQTQMIVIGRIDNARLPSQVAHFVREVEQFKNQVAKGVWKQAAIRLKDKFSPEFFGTRKGYTVTDVIEARCGHGLIIKALAQALEKRKLRFANDHQRDMYVLAKNKKVQCLFEAKTDASTTSIYQGIGQVLYHTALYTPKPQPVLIMPGQPNDRTAKILRRLGIELVNYGLKGKKAEFHGLDRVLRR